YHRKAGPAGGRRSRTGLRAGPEWEPVGRRLAAPGQMPARRPAVLRAVRRRPEVASWEDSFLRYEREITGGRNHFATFRVALSPLFGIGRPPISRSRDWKMNVLSST